MAKRFTAANAGKRDLTIYQGGQAVVREIRQAVLSAGSNMVQLDGLPTQYSPDSLALVSVDGPGKFSPGSVSYRPANFNLPSILLALVGQKVTLVEHGNTARRPITGTVQAVLGNQLVLLKDAYRGRKETTVTLVSLTPEIELSSGIPDSISASPTLLLESTVDKEGSYALRLLYETGGLTWSASYKAFYNEGAQQLTRLDCWVQVTNGSGADYNGVSLKLLAANNAGRRNGAYAKMAGAAPMAASFGAGLESMDASGGGGASESVGQQKMYALDGNWDLGNGESKQICLLQASSVPVTQEFYLNDSGYEQNVSAEDATKQPVYVRLRIANNQNGRPLPAGEVSIFQADSTGAQQKVDSTSIPAVADGERYVLNLRNPSSDVKATRRQISFQETTRNPEDPPVASPALQPVDPSLPTRRSPRAPDDAEPEPRYASEVREIVVHNHKTDRDVEVLVYESFPGREVNVWHKTHDFHEQNDNGGTFKVTVPAGKALTVSYSLKYRIN